MSRNDKAIIQNTCQDKGNCVLALLVASPLSSYIYCSGLVAVGEYLRTEQRAARADRAVRRGALSGAQTRLTGTQLGTVCAIRLLSVV